MPLTRNNTVLLIMVVLVVIAGLIWGWAGFFISACVALLLGSLELLYQKRIKTGCALGGLTLLVIIMAGILIPATRAVPGAARRSACFNHLRMLALACHDYELVHGTLPPPYTVDENGKPLHSWRVLILPFLEENELYKKLDLTKPWDHPDNIKYADQMPSIFRCPSFRVSRDTKREANVTTTYVAIVGEGTVWDPKSEGVSFDKITDGTNQTLLIVEAAPRPVHWMAPQDIRREEVDALKGDELKSLISSHHQGGFNACFADASGHFIPDTIRVEQLKALMTIAGGETIDLDW